MNRATSVVSRKWFWMQICWAFGVVSVVRKLDVKRIESEFLLWDAGVVVGFVE